MGGAQALILRGRIGNKAYRVRAMAVDQPAGTAEERAAAALIAPAAALFLVDSVMGELAERGLEIRLVVHPVFAVERDRSGRLTAYGGAQGAGGAGGGALRESVIHIHIERIDNDAERAEIVQAVEKVLADVRVCVADWRAMMARVGEVVAALRANPPPLPVGETAEAIQFLEWLAGNNFT